MHGQNHIRKITVHYEENGEDIGICLEQMKKKHKNLS